MQYDDNVFILSGLSIIVKRSSLIALTHDEYSRLILLANNRYSHPRHAIRASIILDLAIGTTIKTTAMKNKVNRSTVILWRDRFIHFRLEGIIRDAPRIGSGHKLGSQTAENIREQVLICEPPNGKYWTLQDIAKKNHLSMGIIYRITERYGIILPHSKKKKLEVDCLKKISDLVGFFLYGPIKIFAFQFENESVLAKESDLYHYSNINCQTVQIFFQKKANEFNEIINNISKNPIQISIKKFIKQEILFFLDNINHKKAIISHFLLVMSPSSIENQINIVLWLDKHPQFHVLITSSNDDWIEEISMIAKNVDDRLKREISLQLEYFSTSLIEQLERDHNNSNIYTAIIPFK